MHVSIYHCYWRYDAQHTVGEVVEANPIRAGLWALYDLEAKVLFRGLGGQSLFIFENSLSRYRRAFMLSLVQGQSAQLLVQLVGIHAGATRVWERLTLVVRTGARVAEAAWEVSMEATRIAEKRAMLGEVERIEIAVAQVLRRSLDRLLGHIAERRGREERK
jgi:hypothetical protein